MIFARSTSACGALLDRTRRSSCVRTWRRTRSLGVLGAATVPPCTNLSRTTQRKPPPYRIFVGQSAICGQTNRHKHTSSLHELGKRSTSLPCTGLHPFVGRIVVRFA